MRISCIYAKQTLLYSREMCIVYAHFESLNIVVNILTHTYVAACICVFLPSFAYSVEYVPILCVSQAIVDIISFSGIKWICVKSVCATFLRILYAQIQC